MSISVHPALRLLTQVQALFEPPASWNVSLPRLAALLGETWGASAVSVVLSPPEGGYLRETWGREPESSDRVVEEPVRHGAVPWGKLSLRWKTRSAVPALLETGWLAVIAGIVAEECQAVWAGCSDEPPLDVPLVPGMTLEAHLAAIEKAYLVRALVETHGNMTESARRLGLTKRMILLRMEKFGLRYQTFRRR